MARIPTANDLGRVVARPATGVSSVDISPIARSNQQVADAIGRVGGAFAQAAQEEDRLALGRAQSELIKGQLQLQSDFERDNDYGTMQKRYDDQTAKLSGELGNQITSPRLREEFNNWAGIQNARGQQQVRSMAWGKEKDSNIASLTQTLQDNSNSYMNTTDEHAREQIALSTNNLISGATAKNYITATQGQSLSRSWVTDTAKGSLSMLTPQQRISAIQNGGGLTSFIPADDKKKILDAAAQESINEKIGGVKLSMLDPSVFSGYDVGNGIDSGILHAAMIQQESGGRHFDDSGKLITSSAGARGIGQIMPGTGQSPGFGITPLQNDSVDEHMRVSREYTDAMIKRYNGNPVLALAAYNAGPGKVDEWIKQYGDPRKGDISDEGFANSIPFAETQNYVATVMANATKASAAKAVIGSPEFSLLDGAQKARAVEQAYNAIDTAASAQRFNINQQMQNDIARVNAGQQVENPISVGAFSATMPLNSSPAERAQMWQQFGQYQQTVAMQPAFQGIMSSPADVGLGIVNSMQPKTSDSDFAFKMQRYTQIQQKYAQTIAAREADPGQWLVQYNPDVQEAYRQFGQGNFSGADFIRAVEVQKQRLGIKSKDVIPETMANSLLQQIESSKESSVTAIQQTAQQFGPYADQVMRQVQKKAEPVLQVVMATGNPRAANALWQNRDVKTSELKDSINTASKGSADTADSSWNDASKDFAATMIVQRGGVGIWNNFNEQGRRLTYINMQRGMSASEAAKQAYSDILGSQYQTKGTWRLPNSLSLDVSDVSDGAGAYLEALTADKILPLIADPRIGDDVNRQQSLSRIKDNAEWVTNANETGLMLTLNGMIVNGSDGNPVNVAFSDLSKLGAENRGLFNRVGKAISKPATFTPGQPAQYSIQSQRENLIDIYQQGQRSGR